MNEIREKFINLSKWKMFLLIGVLPVFFVEIFKDIHLIFFGIWIYFINTKFYSLTPESLKNRKLIKLLRYFSLIYIILSIFFTIISVLLVLLFASLGFGGINVTILALSPIIFLIFFVVYLLYLNSKVIVSIEKNKEVNFKESFSTLLLHLFFPIGIIFLQDRILKLNN